MEPSGHGAAWGLSLSQRVAALSPALVYSSVPSPKTPKSCPENTEKV